LDYLISDAILHGSSNHRQQWQSHMEEKLQMVMPFPIGMGIIIQKAAEQYRN
jgi:hypothetical protein